MKNIIFSTFELCGKATKLIVSLTSSTTSNIVGGFKSGYTGQPKQVERQVERPVYKEPVQKEFDFDSV